MALVRRDGAPSTHTKLRSGAGEAGQPASAAVPGHGRVGARPVPQLVSRARASPWPRGEFVVFVRLKKVVQIVEN